MSLLSSMAGDTITITLQILILLSLPLNLQCSNSQSWIRGGYWLPRTQFPLSDINSNLFTHLMCGYAHINTSTYHILINSTYERSFSNFTDSVKRKNPSVITLLSISVGRKYSSIFASMISQTSNRKTFIESSIRAARLYGFHGLDLCGVRPKRSINMTNLETLLDEWRAAVTSESINSGKPQLLLVMSSHHLPASDSVTYPVDSMQRNLDWVHLMTYDYHVPSKDNFTRAHAALYSPSGWFNTNNSSREWLHKGLQANKLLLGLPSHGWAWTLVNPKDNAFGSPASGPAVTSSGMMTYKFIKTRIQTYGYGDPLVYNDTYVVNVFTFTRRKIWVNFDGVEAIRAKVSFAKEKALLGYTMFQLAHDYNWELSSAAQEEGRDEQHKPKLLIIIVVTAAILLLLLGTIICCLRRIPLNSKGVISTMKTSVSKLKSVSPGENLNNNANNLQIFSFTIIKEATNNFSSENKLGEGGYGPVYKGTLPDGQEIAVKRLSKTSRQGLEEFKNEIELTARLQHVNLVPVVGICTQREEKMLIYEYMPNKSLDFYIFDPSLRYLLNWRKRIHISDGIIQGLLYLQEYSNFTIVHRDLKASNILLDKEMNPKISDFSMAKAFTKNECEANTGRIVGTYGYVPPEYVKRGIYSMKFDVYSYGVLLLQIISGKKTAGCYGPSNNLTLLEYGYELWKDGGGMEFFDSSLDDSSAPWKLMRCMQVALLCVQENPADRPTMLEVYTMLKSENAAIPSPKRPAFSVKRDEDEESKCLLQVNICSVNDVTITQLVAR